MTDTQVAFEDLITTNNKKNSSKSSSKKSTTKKSVTKKTSTKPSATKKNVSKKANKKVEKQTAEKSAAKSSNPKKSSSKRVIKNKNSKVNVTQEDMDKLCEVYDWYLQVKDLDIIEANANIKKTSIKIYDNIIKDKKRISSIVDESIWEDFSRLCENTCHKKGDVLTQAIKEFLIKHKDLI